VNQKERRSRVFSAFRCRLYGAKGLDRINREGTAEKGESAAEEARNANASPTLLSKNPPKNPH